MTAAGRAPGAGDGGRRVAAGLLAILAFALPFELDRPWLRLGPVAFTNLELLLIGAVAAAWVAVAAGYAASRAPEAAARVPPASAARGRPIPMPPSWLLLWALFGAALVASAWLAPEFRGNALKGALRTLAGLLLAVTVAAAVRGRREALWLMAGACAGGLLSAGIGMAEVLRGEGLAWMDALRPRPTRVGSFLRLTGTFDYANTAGMYLEATSPLLVAVGYVLWRRRRGRGPARALLAAALALALAAYLQATILTYSRAAITSLFLSALIVGALARQRRREDARRRAAYLGLAGSAAAILVVNLALNPVASLRFGTAGPEEWYRAGVDAPDTLELREGEVRQVAVRVANRGALAWAGEGPHPVRLGARWIPLGDSALPAEELRWPLPGAMAPGDSLRLRVPLRAPSAAGSYELRWDVIQEGVAWFSDRAGSPELSRVEVLDAGDVEGPGPSPSTAAGAEAAATGHPVPGRRTLWRIALAEFADRPWLGIGTDNFRRVYGRRLGRAQWDETVHTNNWYLQTLVTAGLAGALPFFAWLALLLADVLGVLRRGEAGVVRMGLAAALLAYLIHGLLDYFLAFHSTGLLFWLVVGLWARLRTLPPPGPTAATA